MQFADEIRGEDVDQGDGHDPLFQETAAPGVGVTTKRPTTRPRHFATISVSGPGMPNSRAGQRIPTSATSPLDWIRASGGSESVRSKRHARNESSFDQRRGLVDDLVDGCRIGGERRRCVDHLHVGGGTVRGLPMAATARRELGHKDADHEDGDRGLEVRVDD